MNERDQQIAALYDRIKALEDQQVVRTVELLRPQPGDILLLTLPVTVGNVQRTQIAQAFRQACPGCRIAVLYEPMAVRVVRAADIPEDEVKGPGFEPLNRVQQRPTELAMP